MRVSRKLTTVGLFEELAHKRIVAPAAPIFAASGPTDWGLVTALPVGAAVGDTCCYKADVTNGVFWDLVYDGVGSFPWKHLGSRPLSAEVATQQTTTSVAYADLATVGPSVTVPLKGDYEITIASVIANSGVAISRVAYAMGAAAAADADAALFEGPASTAPIVQRTKKQLALAAGAAVVAKYKVSAGTGFFSARRLAVDPVRVG